MSRGVILTVYFLSLASLALSIYVTHLQSHPPAQPVDYGVTCKHFHRPNGVNGIRCTGNAP